MEFCQVHPLVGRVRIHIALKVQNIDAVQFYNSHDGPVSHSGFIDASHSDR